MNAAKKQTITVLGATGSLGTSTLDVLAAARARAERVRAEGVATTVLRGASALD